MPWLQVLLSPTTILTARLLSPWGNALTASQPPPVRSPLQAPVAARAIFAKLSSDFVTRLVKIVQWLLDKDHNATVNKDGSPIPSR